jgi:hypothetical protein
MPKNHMARALTLASLPLLALAFTPAQAQTPQLKPEPIERPADTHPTPNTYTLRVTAREVVIDVAALDHSRRPVTDLKPEEFQVFELFPHAPRQPMKISAFHIGDPALEPYHPGAPSGGFRINLGGGCAMSTTFHYQIAYQPGPEGWTSGYHDILITTTRPKVTLAYRRRYYVGLTGIPPNPPRLVDTDPALRQAACFHAATPPSIAFNATPIPGSPPGRQLYSLVLQPDSLAFTSIFGDTRRVQLDYGVCTFDRDGKPLAYMHTNAEQKLTPELYQQVLSEGFKHNLDMPLAGDPAVMRFVVRDRETGNLGSSVVAVIPPELLEQQANAKASGLQKENRIETQTRQVGLLRQQQAAMGNIGWFGSILPRPGALCGDVYDIPRGSSALLASPWDSDPIGALYTYNLNIPIESIPGGLPGVTSSPEWFDIDYNGIFWTSTPGLYRFVLTSDDGSKLYIDDQKLIDIDGHHHIESSGGSANLTSGRHTIHIPYFQGPLAVALILQVQAPGDNEYKIFDLRDFPQPQPATAPPQPSAAATTAPAPP